VCATAAVVHIHHLGGGHDASRGDLLSCDRSIKKKNQQKIAVLIKSSQAAARVRFRYYARVV